MSGILCTEPTRYTQPDDAPNDGGNVIQGNLGTMIPRAAFHFSVKSPEIRVQTMGNRNFYRFKWHLPFGDEYLKSTRHSEASSTMSPSCRSWKPAFWSTNVLHHKPTQPAKTMCFLSNTWGVYSGRVPWHRTDRACKWDLPQNPRIVPRAIRFTKFACPEMKRVKGPSLWVQIINW